MHTIAAIDDHLLVEIHGDFGNEEIWEAIVALMSRPDFAHKNDIWVLGDGRPSLQFGDLQLLARNVARILPRTLTRTKTALVAPEGLTRAMAQIWVEAARGLPYEVRIFATLAGAEAWVTAPA